MRQQAASARGETIGLLATGGWECLTGSGRHKQQRVIGGSCKADSHPRQ